jgi:hypothetical protein
MEAGDGQQRAVGRPIDRGDYRWAVVNGRMFGVDRRRRAGRRVVFGAFFDPTLDERDFGIAQRLFPLGHRRFAVGGRDLFDQVAFVRLAWHDGRRFTLAALQERFESRHIQRAARFGRLMAALAVGLEYWPDVARIANRCRLCRGIRLRRLLGCGICMIKNGQSRRSGGNHQRPNETGTMPTHHSTSSPRGTKTCPVVAWARYKIGR